ncbi:MAG: ATP synthase subunit I [Marinospirillum sp.]|uniref:ATP synthase subunit I n=1 Tax=Marinospirillum sp. TaxID=2183934 RepID=UPI001A008E13|nr:ATP synthase subunit I [Marinospirillum sp.]MBE0505149.1 ATP synthase subunit I [Marinospirillum sp.]
MAAVPLPPYKRLLMMQAAAVVLVSLLAELISKNAGVSALLGGLIAFIPHAAFSGLMFRHRGARRVNQAVQLMFMAEMVKLGLTVVLFALVFIGVQPSNPISLLCAYTVVLMVHWLAPWLMQTGR